MMEHNHFYFKNNWSNENLDGFWKNPKDFSDGRIIHSNVINNEVYHLSKTFMYTGIEWGWIHVWSFNRKLR